MKRDKIKPRTTPPDLEDESKYRKVASVPIFATHVRKHFDEEGRPYLTEVDDDQLEALFNNTVERCKGGYVPSLRLGHIRHDRPETDQPPHAGFFVPTAISEYNGKKTILADMYIDKSITYVDKDSGNRITLTDDEVLKQCPHRSSEVYRKTLPEGFISGVALLTRQPELDLGLVTYASENFEAAKDYEYFCVCEEGKGMDQNAAGASPGPGNDAQNMERDVAIEKLANAMVVKMASHEGLGSMMSGNMDSIVNKVADAVMARITPMLESKKEEPAAPAPAPEESNPVNEDDAAPDMDEEIENQSEDEEETDDDMNKKKDEDMDNEQFNAMTVENAVLKNQNALLMKQKKELEDSVKSLTTRMENFEAFQAQETQRHRLAARRAQLEQLASDGYKVDVDEEVEAFSSVDDEHFSAHLGRIKKSYARVAGNSPLPFRIAPSPGVKAPKANDGSVEDPITENDDVTLFAAEMSDKLSLRKNEDRASWGRRVVDEYIKLPPEERAKYQRKPRVG